MARILITSGPTREYFDPVRFISNRSSGRMGVALAEAALKLGHDVTVVSGPVDVDYPENAKTLHVETTQQMDDLVSEFFPQVDGIIAAAAPCDFRPVQTHSLKIKKTGQGMNVRFEETSDILARASTGKTAQQWSVGFALETEDGVKNAKKKLAEKNLDLIVLNGPEAMNSTQNKIRIIDANGVIAESCGPKLEVATVILATVEEKIKERLHQQD